MTETARAGGPGADLEIDLRDASWVRIQLHLRIRPRPGGIDPGELRLRQAGGTAGAWMGPTGIDPDGDDRIVRFNVMQGPGLMPLDVGDWDLQRAAGRDDLPGIHVRVVTAGAESLDDAVGRFVLRRGIYEVVPSLDAETRSLRLRVSLGPPTTDPPPPEPWTLVRARNRIIRRLRRPGFRLLYRLMRLAARHDGRHIVFSSDSRAELGGNLKVVYDRMVERGLDRDHDLQTIFKPSVTDRRSMGDRIRLPRLLARADVILLDDYQPVIYRLDDPHVRIVQLWHASGAFKTVGYSRVGKPGGPSPYSRVHKNYTHAIVSSDHDVPFYAEAFGIPEARVVPTGIPRMDRFFDEAKRDAAREAAHVAFPASRGRMTILFAPTFRGDTPRTAFYSEEHLDYAALHALAVERDAVVIFKMHPFVRQPLQIPAELTDRLIDGTRTAIDVNDLLFAVDLLITDYSSIVFEFSTLGRPMLFFAYDLDEYIAGRDFYVPFEEFVPGRIARTFPEVLDAIRHDDFQVEKVGEFARRHFAHLDGSSTDRVIDELVLGR